MTARGARCLFGVFSVLFVACVGDPLEGKHFACDPSVKDSCAPGFICVPVVHEKVKGVCLTPAEVEAYDIKLGDHDVGISETSIPDETSVGREDVGTLERPSADDTPLAEEDFSILERPGGDEISDEGQVICVPTGQEQCNDNIDNDCNGLTDEEGALGCVVYYKDEDKDGFGVSEDSKCLCEAKTPYTARQAGDCDDSNAQAYPGGVEVCANNIDDNCNGQTDEAGCQECSLYYKDQDADGFGVTSDSRCLREATVPYTAIRGGDCDDNDATINPGAAEKCNDKDDNCNGATDETWPLKGEPCDGPDSDWCPEGQYVCRVDQSGLECNDTTGDSVEVCDGKDNDCDGLTDEENAQNCQIYYLDADSDTYGVTGNARCLCSPSGDYKATRGGDCDDTDASINPAATERCNDKDDNCNGATDETWPLKDAPCDGPDSDLCREGWYVCKADGSGIECNDTTGDTVEVCDGKDNDCDGLTDEEGAQGCVRYFYDFDGDNFGISFSKCLCAPDPQTMFTALNTGDCNDNDPNINPSAVERCNNKDDNCDGQIDEERTSGQCGRDGYTLYYYDGDGDTYGVAANTRCLCSPSGKYTAISGGDCNDSDARVHPDASAVCGIDADCDGSLLDPGEACDDGNSVRWDGCTDCVYLEFQVNTWTTSDQFGPFITSLSNGGFVVVWTSDGQDGSQWGVYGQRFDSNGNKVGSEFRVNAWTTSAQHGPSIASLSNGGFVVVWGSAGQDGSSDGVYGQRFDSNGNKVGSEFQVNTWTAGWQGTSFVTSLSDGGFVVVWESTGQDGSGFGLYGQRFDSNGNKVGSEFRVNTWTTGDQDIPSVSSFYNGGFVVVWHSNGQDGSGFGIYGQRFDSDGSKVGSEFQVNTWTPNDQIYPSITSLSNGGFVVVWQSNGQDGSGSGVYGRIFSQ